MQYKFLMQYYPSCGELDCCEWNIFWREIFRQQSFNIKYIVPANSSIDEVAFFGGLGLLSVGILEYLGA